MVPREHLDKQLMAKRLKTQLAGAHKQILGSIASVKNRIDKMTVGMETPDADMRYDFSLLYILHSKKWNLEGYICQACNQMAGKDITTAKRHLLICKNNPLDK
jgi:hypothetical protein